MKRFAGFGFAGFVVAVLSATASAQTPEPAPRWPDGHVNLGSTKEHKGYWEVRPGLGGMPRGNEIPAQPWARALQQFRTSKNDLYPPLVRCKPAAGSGFFTAPGFEIVESPEEKKVYILDIAGPHSWRVIYMDGRTHPANLRPTYLGHSIGHWDGDTLVVDTVGFNEQAWMERWGMPHTDRLHTIERITRTDFDTMNYEVTIDDPGAYTAPWTSGYTKKWQAGTEAFEYVCQENNFGPQLMIGVEDGERRANLSFIP